MKSSVVKIRLYLTIAGVLVFYTAIHEFAYRRYETGSAVPAEDTTRANSAGHSACTTMVADSTVEKQ